MSRKRKHRQLQKHRVLKMQEYVAGMNPYDFAALMTVLDSLEDFEPGVGMVKWPRYPTFWEKVKQYFRREDAEDN